MHKKKEQGNTFSYHGLSCSLDQSFAENTLFLQSGEKLLVHKGQPYLEADFTPKNWRRYKAERIFEIYRTTFPAILLFLEWITSNYSPELLLVGETNDHMADFAIKRCGFTDVLRRERRDTDQSEVSVSVDYRAGEKRIQMYPGNTMYSLPIGKSESRMIITTVEEITTSLQTLIETVNRQEFQTRISKITTIK